LGEQEIDMNKLALSSSIVGVLLVASLATPVHALSARAWVSGHGTDAGGCGGVTSPCRTPQYVLDNIIAPGGEIDILDPAGYGAVTISHAVSIINDGVGTAGFIQTVSGQNVITITAGASDAITLRGLNINGSGVANDGISFQSGGSLQVENCVIGDVTFQGIQIATNSASNFTVTDVIATKIGSFGTGNGIYVAPSASTIGTVKRFTSTNNGSGGISLFGGNASSPATIFVSVADSVLANNSEYGSWTGSTGTGVKTTLVLQNMTISGNVDGIVVNNNGAGMNDVFVVLANSTVAGSPIGAYFQGGGVISTLQNNVFSDNGTDVSGGSLTALPPK
jgi:hypothetical protein